MDRFSSLQGKVDQEEVAVETFSFGQVPAEAETTTASLMHKAFLRPRTTRATTAIQMYLERLVKKVRSSSDPHLDSARRTSTPTERRRGGLNY